MSFSHSARACTVISPTIIGLNRSFVANSILLTDFSLINNGVISINFNESKKCIYILQMRFKVKHISDLYQTLATQTWMYII